MSDAKLRDLERQAARDGSLATQVELLLARLRGGTLSHEWLEVAARLGSAPARKALGRFVRVEDPVRTRRLLRLSREVCVSVALRITERRLEQHAQAQVDPPSQEILLATQAIRGWLETPDDRERLEACADALNTLHAAATTAQAEIQGLHEEASRLRQDFGDHTWTNDQIADHQLSQELSQARVLKASQHVVGLALALRALRCVLALTESEAADVLEADALPLEREAGGVEVIRQLLARWALAPARAHTHPPDDWFTPRDEIGPPLASPATPESGPSPSEAFEAALKDKEVKKQATALRKRLRAKELDRDLVALAARLGDPAAWLVAKPDGGPALEPPNLDPEAAGEAMNGQLMTLIASFAKALPKDEVRRIKYLQRLRDPDGEGGEVGPAWPDWARQLVARLGLALGDSLLPTYEAANPEREAPRQALEAARAFHLRPHSDPAPVLALAKAATQQVGRRGRRPDQVKSAGRVVGWAAELVVRAHQKARQPRMDYANRQVLRECLIAGVGPQSLWDLLRHAAIAWALGSDDLGLNARPYAPRESFAVGETIQHSKFGQGKVVAVRGKKLEVEFEDGPKTLVHAG